VNTIETVQALAKECGATTYTNRSAPDTAWAFGPEAWAKFCAALLVQMQAAQSPAPAAHAPTDAQSDTAEFEMHCNGVPEASTSGPRADAWREIQHYAAQYSHDGPVEIYEVTRTLCALPLSAAPEDTK
jgi:hypothetical protein